MRAFWGGRSDPRRCPPPLPRSHLHSPKRSRLTSSDRSSLIRAQQEAWKHRDTTLITQDEPSWVNKLSQELMRISLGHQSANTLIHTHILYIINVCWNRLYSACEGNITYFINPYYMQLEKVDGEIMVWIITCGIFRSSSRASEKWDERR